MIVVNPQYITDSAGKKSMVVLPVVEFEAIMEALEDIEDARLYDEVRIKENSDSKPYSLSDEQQQILNERLMEDKSNFVPARELVNQLRKKHGL